jgi:hypothetical protein
MNEHDLTRKVVDWLAKTQRGGAPLWYLKVHGDRYQRDGVPDIIMCVNSHFAAVELKHPDESDPQPSPIQRLEMIRIARAGGLVACMNNMAQFMGVVGRLLP